MSIEASKADSLTLISATVVEGQKSLEQGLYPSTVPRKTLEEKVDELLSAQPNATAGANVSEAAAKVGRLKARLAILDENDPPSARASFEEALKQAEAEHAKFLKKPVGPRAVVAALEACVAAHNLNTEQAEAGVATAQAKAEGLRAARVATIKLAREQLDTLERKVAEEEAPYLEALRVRGVERTTQTADIHALLKTKLESAVQTAVAAEKAAADSAKALDEAMDAAPAPPNPVTAAAPDQPAAIAAAASSATEALTKQMTLLQERLALMASETDTLKAEQASFRKQKAALQRYLLVVPIDRAQLLEVLLPPADDPSRACFLQLYHLPQHWRLTGRLFKS